VITYHVQKLGGANKLDLALGARLANACLSCAAYLRKFFLPLDLAIFYPLRPPDALSAARVLAAAALLLVLTAVAVMRMRRQPYLFTGWFWYLGTLLPVIGLVQVGLQSMADRYTYVPMIGFTLALTWGVCDAARRCRLPAFVLPAAAGLVLAACALLTLRQIGFWKDSETAFRRSLAVTPGGNALAHLDLGMALLQTGRSDEAISHFQQVLEVRKNEPGAYFNIGMALLKKGDFSGAAGNFRTALASMPGNYQAHFYLGVALQGMGDWSEAAPQFQEAIKLNPESEDAYLRYAEMLGNLGRLKDAIAQYQALLHVNPRSFGAHTNLGVAFSRLKQWDDAIREFQDALNENPDVVETHNDLGVAFQNEGKLNEAIEQYREAVRLDPDYAAARENLESLLKSRQSSPHPE
jgi:tetratricopeptide (TPR) repeat protein